MIGKNRKRQKEHQKTHQKTQQKAQGSFTVEAALVLPIVLFSIYYFLNQGIALYCQVAAVAENQGIWESFDPASRFRQLELMGELIK